jgi:hypothetical protein
MTTPTFTTPPAVIPARGSSTFSTDASAWVTWQNGFEGELTTAMPWVAARVADVAADLVLTNADVLLTAADVIAAAASAAAAVVASNAAEWVSEASYAEFANVISPVDFGTYRAKTTHTGVATDPSADTTNWTLISARPITTASTAPSYQDAVVVLTGTTPAVDLSAAGEYRLTTTGDTTFTVSNPPPDGGAIPAEPALNETKEYTLRASTVSGTTIYVLTETGVVS